MAEDQIIDLQLDDVFDLHGIDCLTKLERLRIQSSHPLDLSPLAGHPTLRSLAMGGSNSSGDICAPLADLAPLGSIPHLASLGLGYRGGAERRR